MSLALSRPEPRPERLTAHEARQRLEHERNSRLTQLNAIEEAEHGTSDHFVTAQKDSVRRVLEEIDAAFARIADGSYGTCTDCARPIPPERLEILPHARCCVACQRRTA
ncbi:transcriptional regulator, TraR/DksA family [Streptomyces sp. WMMB 714]|uniref:TraR/DksA C4-type zinc finger protein n=1 Tax=Streptomyces sp. WMMB 714 TaxID=1286822 RepID=UPI0005F8422C|nr:TraR/DksA C4-type zinc finger protein [Streptomyces sp. WMMB 714]SCK19933.1 transcriptional regulator, TraR/DksA family [Streptomyces sp. WMMB 714]